MAKRKAWERALAQSITGAAAEAAVKIKQAAAHDADADELLPLVVQVAREGKLSTLISACRAAGNKAGELAEALADTVAEQLVGEPGSAAQPKLHSVSLLFFIRAAPGEVLSLPEQAASLANRMFAQALGVQPSDVALDLTCYPALSREWRDPQLRFNYLTARASGAAANFPHGSEAAAGLLRLPGAGEQDIVTYSPRALVAFVAADLPAGPYVATWQFDEVFLKAFSGAVSAALGRRAYPVSMGGLRSLSRAAEWHAPFAALHLVEPEIQLLRLNAPTAVNIELRKRKMTIEVAAIQSGGGGKRLLARFEIEEPDDEQRMEFFTELSEWLEAIDTETLNAPNYMHEYLEMVDEGGEAPDDEEGDILEQFFEPEGYDRLLASLLQQKGTPLVLNPRQPRPLAFVTEYGRRYPGLLEALAHQRQARGTPRLTAPATGHPIDWPRTVYAPSCLLNNIMLGDKARTAAARDINASDFPYVARILQALAAWNDAKAIYRFEPGLLARLWRTPHQGPIATSVFSRLPQHGIYIETPGTEFMATGLNGFFAHLDWVYTDNTFTSGFYTMFVVLDLKHGLLPMELDLDKDLEHSMDWATTDEHIEQSPALLAALGPRGGPSAALKEMIRDVTGMQAIMLGSLVSLVFHLCQHGHALVRTPGQAGTIVWTVAARQ